MIRRPITQIFNAPLLAGVKTTTIRPKPWPVGVPIMLYNWSGAAYRSKQADVAVVSVREVRPISITRLSDVEMVYAYGEPEARRLHETEGFGSREELDSWFRPLVGSGETVVKWMMFFWVEKPAVQRTCRTCKYWSTLLGRDEAGLCRTESGEVFSWDFETCEGWEENNRIERNASS